MKYEIEPRPPWLPPKRGPIAVGATASLYLVWRAWRLLLTYVDDDDLWVCIFPFLILRARRWDRPVREGVGHARTPLRL